MRFMADENFPRHAVIALRESGFDVAWITEEAPAQATTEFWRPARQGAEYR